MPLVTTSTPKVFISSTLEDLADYRAAAQNAILRMEWQPIDSGYWAAEGNPPLHVCLEKVDDADLVVVIVARRHGWTPPDQPDGGHKSITRLECERAHVERKIEVIPFFLNDAAPWDAKLDEANRIHEAPPEKIADVAVEVGRNVAELHAFRTWLGAEFTRDTFSNPDELGGKVLHALMKWGERHGQAGSTACNASIRSDYLAWLRRTCESVELLGLDAKETNNVRLGQVYVPAVTAFHGHYNRRLLLDRLGEESLYVPGSPGAGKSTFCRWVALAVASRGIPPHPVGTPDEFEETLPVPLHDRFPLLFRLRELAGHQACLAGNGTWTRKQLEDALACWLDATRPGGLTSEVFREELSEGRCFLVLDGVDEVPERLGDHLPRRNLLTGLADALPGWLNARDPLEPGKPSKPGNRVLLTSRPYALTEADRRCLALPMAELAELPGELQTTFVHRWYAAADPPHAREKATGLIAHLDDRPDLAELRANPMLLTALCVKYDEGQRLPQDFYRLYDSVVNQVLYKRYTTEVDRDRARLRLAAVALGMHRGDARRTHLTPEAEVSMDEIDRHLAALSRSDPTTEDGAVDAAIRREDLLSNSGLLLSRGEGRGGFYHLSFQEFLAALRLRAIDESPHEILDRHAATLAWHRTLTFLFCALADQGSAEAAVNGYAPLIDHLSPDRLEADPVPALLLADCLEIAHARGWNLARFAGSFRRACDHCLRHIRPPERAHLWRTLGRIGLDDRPGVGVIDDLPDIDWVEVPGGTFLYGARGEEISLGPFRIARYPVTHAQFQAFIDDDGYRAGAWWEGLAKPPSPARPHWTHPNHPRETVSCHEAIAFCRWLTARFRAHGDLPTASEIRLPSKQEWERAARGTDGREYPWGKFRSDHANLDETAGEAGPHYLQRTSAVGIYPLGASPCGALDMSGNVWEWCLNEHQLAAGTFVEAGDSGVVRGGSWAYGPHGGHCTNLMYLGSQARHDYVGFRLACLHHPVTF